jgi:putative phosphoesterase
MMRVAALYDIHGNLPALEAVIDELHQLNVTDIVVGGDVVPGPMSRETLTMLLGLERPVHFIQGNCEVAVIAEAAGEDPGIPEQAREAMRWAASQLDAGLVRTLSSWPKTLCLSVDGLGNVLFCHATPRNENECFVRTTPEDRLVPIFEGRGASVVVCGHTHMQFDRMIGSVRVVNAGSVGMPFGQPGAYWLLLGPEVNLRRTLYDVSAAAARMRGTTYPDVANFAERYVEHPPPEAVMLDVFSRSELKD